MGGLMKRVPITFVTFVIGSLALSGFPGLAGSFSKDEILVADANYNTWLFWMGLGAAVLTAFYMTRLVVVVFLNKPMSEKVSHAGESPLVMIVPLVILSFNAIFLGWPWFAHFFNLNLQPVVEKSTLPVHVLAIAALFSASAMPGGSIATARTTPSASGSSRTSSTSTSSTPCWSR